MRYQLELRKDTASRWARLNTLLADGEPGFEKDTGKFKIGDGSTLWNDLPYFIPRGGEGTGSEELDAHINSTHPHPAYDDGPDLTLLYENAKV